MDINAFYQNAAGFAPNPLQQAVWDAYAGAEGHPALLVRAGTGAGKTEAVLFPALADSRFRRRIILILPSKALIEDMGERIKGIGERLSASGVVDLDITVDMGGSCRRYQCRNGAVNAHTHFRHLFADDIILTTLDKFLFRIFGYGEQIKSFIFPHRIFGSAVGKKPFVIFDEAHEYDGPAFSNFIRLIEALYTKGKDLCVMSATLPPRFVDFLKPVDAVSGELGRRQSDATARRIICGEKRLTLLDGKDEGPNSLVSTIASAVRARHAPHLRIIARTEYISDLIELYASLKDLDPLVYHGRMTSSQRREVIQTILRRQAGNEGFLVLATAAIEAGCDLDAHLIVTELCNPDSLVQLAGRLNRRGRMTGAELVVVGERLKPMTADLRDETMERYLSDLKEMGGRFAPEQLSHYFVPPDGDWMSEILFGMLYDYVYEGDLSAKPLWDRGILVTRSWEPAVTLCTGIDQKTGRPVNPVQIGVSRLAKKIGKGFDALKKEKISKYLSISDSGKWHANVERAFFNADRGEEGRWTHYQLKSYPISSYENTLICIIEPEYTDRYFNPILGYIRIPKIFIKSNREGFRQYLDQPVFKKDGCFAFEGNYMKRSARIWYLGAITCR